jgi:hypothetical protein
MIVVRNAELGMLGAECAVGSPNFTPHSEFRTPH